MPSDDSNDVDPELLLAKQEYLRLLRLKRELLKTNGLASYRPHPKQDAFHRAGAFSRRAFFAGNRTGKSDCGAAEDVAQLVGERTWYPKTDPARTAGIPNRPQRGLVICNDWDKVDEIFTTERGAVPGKLWRLFPQGFVKAKHRNHSGAIDLIECANGSLLRFDTVKSYMGNPLGSESSDWDFIHVDEPCPKGMFDAVSRGLVDRSGRAYFTLTPLREPWIYDFFYGMEDAADQANIAKTEAFVYKDASDPAERWSITGSIYDNPYLSKDAIDSFLAQLDPEEKECRAHGIPLQFAGVIYKEFSTAIHCYHTLPDRWLAPNRPPSDYSTYFYLDPHPQTPVAVLFVAVSPTGRKYLYDELFIKGTAYEIAQEITARLAGTNFIHGCADPCAFNVDDLTGSCWATDFAQCGVFFAKANKDLVRGIPSTKGALRSMLPDGSPEWVVSPALRRFIWEIKRYSWDPKRPDKPIDKDDHMMENFYRAVLDNPVWRELDVPRPIADMPFAPLRTNDMSIKDLMSF